MVRKPNILILGWDDHPEVTGGLGNACQAMIHALNGSVSIQAIFPKVNNKSLLEKVKEGEVEFIDAYKPASPAYQPEPQPVYTPGSKSITIPWENVDPYAPYQPENIDEPQRQYFQEIQDKVSHHFLEEEEAPEQVSQKSAAIFEFGDLATQLGVVRNFDLIHAHDWPTFLPAIALKEATGKPLVLHIHSLAYDRYGFNGSDWSENIERVACEIADRIIVPSEYTAALVTSIYQVSPTRIRVIPNGATIEKPTYSAFNSSAKVVVFAGRMTAQKGPALFVKMAIELLKKNAKVRFIMAGDGPLRKELIQQVDDAQVGHSFYFPGMLEAKDLATLFSKTDLFVMPSLSEPFGIVALEAAKLGVPCLLSHNAGVTEVLPSAPTFNPTKQKAWIKSMQKLLTKDKKRKKLGRKLLKEADQVTWEKMAGEVNKVYTELL